MKSINFIGGRKMAVGFLVLGVGVALSAARGDIPPNLLQLLSVIFGGFVVGNGFEHVARSMRKSEPPTQPAQVDLSPLSQQVGEVKALAEQAAQSGAVSAQALSMIIERYKIGQ